MKMKRPPSHWVIVAVSAVIGVGVYLGISGRAREQEETRQVEIARSEDRAVDHMCAQWKTDRAQFSDCGGAYRIYEKCEAAMARMLEREGITNAAGVACEHPVYQFHAREQKEIEDATRGQH